MHYPIYVIAWFIPLAGDGKRVDGIDEQTTITAHGAFPQGGSGSVLGGNKHLKFLWGETKSAGCLKV
jgi:hypothetical protein